MFIIIMEINDNGYYVATYGKCAYGTSVRKRVRMCNMYMHVCTSMDVHIVTNYLIKY